MATSSGDSSILEDELTCTVCLDLYHDPHLLPCGHNFCLPCLSRLKTRSERGQLRCPECRQSHSSSATWQKNYKLANIADSFRRRGESEPSSYSQGGPSHTSTEVRCDYCPANGGESNPKAVKTCLKCEVSMCPKHVQPHLELPAFREHPLVEPLNDMRKRKCTEHDEMFKYYCVDERMFMCNACNIEGTHSGHSIKTLKNAMKDFKRYLDIQLHKVNRKLLKVEKNQQELNEIERHNKAYLDDTDRHLYSFRENSIAHLDAFLASIHECIYTHEVDKGGEVQQNLKLITQDQTRLQEVHSGLERLLQENDPFQFIRDYNSSAKRYRKLLRKPLYFSNEPTIDTESLDEILERKMADFIAELQHQTNALIGTVCNFEEGDGEDEVDEDDEDDDSGSEVEDEEEEEEMRSEDDNSNSTGRESLDEEYTPEEYEEYEAY